MNELCNQNDLKCVRTVASGPCFQTDLTWTPVFYTQRPWAGDFLRKSVGFSFRECLWMCVCVNRIADVYLWYWYVINLHRTWLDHRRWFWYGDYFFFAVCRFICCRCDDHLYKVQSGQQDWLWNQWFVHHFTIYNYYFSGAKNTYKYNNNGPIRTAYIYICIRRGTMEQSILIYVVIERINAPSISDYSCSMFHVWQLQEIFWIPEIILIDSWAWTISPPTT